MTKDENVTEAQLQAAYDEGFGDGCDVEEGVAGAPDWKDTRAYRDMTIRAAIAASPPNVESEKQKRQAAALRRMAELDYIIEGGDDWTTRTPVEPATPAPVESGVVARVRAVLNSIPEPTSGTLIIGDDELQTDDLRALLALASSKEERVSELKRIASWFEGYIANGGKHAGEELRIVKSMCAAQVGG